MVGLPACAVLRATGVSSRRSWTGGVAWWGAGCRRVAWALERRSIPPPTGAHDPYVLISHREGCDEEERGCSGSPLPVVSLEARREEALHQSFSRWWWPAARSSATLEGGGLEIFLPGGAYFSVPRDGRSSEKSSSSRRGAAQGTRPRAAVSWRCLSREQPSLVAACRNAVTRASNREASRSSARPRFHRLCPWEACFLSFRGG